MSPSPLFTTADLDAATHIVRASMPPTPQYVWPLLAEAVRTEVWVKHENHTPTGAFKVRGGLVLLAGMRQSGRVPAGLVSATRGNHGQSLAFAGRQAGVPVTIVVPHGNSTEKNAAMRAYGAQLIVEGRDFDEARAHAAAIAADRGWDSVPTFHPDLVRGVATYAKELFDAAGELDAVYVPIGMGSGICGLLTVRDLLGLRTEVIGVVADGAPAYALSVEAGRPVSTEHATTFVDGVACRIPDPAAVELIGAGAARILRIPDVEVADAMRLLYRTTHNVAEPAGAIAVAGLCRESERQRGRRVGVILTGGNVDTAHLRLVLAGDLPAAS